MIAPAISGAGQSEIGRRLGRDPLELTLDACLAAIADAGLTRDDIDGLSTYPGPMSTPPGFSGAGAYDVIDALRLSVNWYDSGLETSGQLGSVIKACMAVGAGMCDHVLCFRSVWEGSAQGDQGRSAVTTGGSGGNFKASGFLEWNLPFSAPSASIWIAQFAQAHFHKYGTTKEQLAWIALNGRRNAELNPNAIYRTPMTMDDYMASRIITTPFSLFDCDVPCDGATAVIVSRARSGCGLAAPAVAGGVDGRGAARSAVVGSVRRSDHDGEPRCRCAAVVAHRPEAGRRADAAGVRRVLVPHDVVDRGAGVLRGGGERPVHRRRRAHRARRVLPLNTHGGQLSAGRLHGYGFLHEAAVQMWGEAGDRQIATPPEVGVVAAGGGNTCGCLLLVRD